MYIYIFILILVIIFGLIIYFRKKKPKKYKKYKKKKLTDLIPLPLQKKDYDAYNIIPNSFLTLDINQETFYLTYRYSGEDIRGKQTYNIVLLPYKNKQNEFKIHLKDHKYLMPFYQQYGLFYPDLVEYLNKQVIAESEYNKNKEQYLELEKDSDNLYFVRASLFSEKVNIIQSQQE